MLSVHRPIVVPKAPAAFSCRTCDRAYPTANALELHYRDTPVHPKCTRCDIGFVDNAAMQTVSSVYMLPMPSVYDNQLDQSTWFPSTARLPAGSAVACKFMKRIWIITTKQVRCMHRVRFVTLALRIKRHFTRCAGKSRPYEAFACRS